MYVHYNIDSYNSIDNSNNNIDYNTYIYIYYVYSS